MGSEWSETNVGNLLLFANGRSSPERADGLPYSVYGSNGIIGYANKTNADAGAIIIGRVGSYCGSLYQSTQKCWVTDNAIRAVAKNGHNPRFLFYLLGTLSLNNRRAGSGQPLLNQDILSRIPAIVPEPPEQRRIAHILGTFDDKIENNRKTAKKLEAMAQAIFQSWFVDFDPVRAKMAGESRESICKRLKITPEILDLFPDRLVDSELGEIPEGWVDGSFGNICSRRSIRIGDRDATVLSAVTEGRLAISDNHFTKRVYSNDIKNYLAVERYDFAYNPSRINIGSIGMLKSHFLGAVSPVYIVFRPVEGYQQFINFYLGLAITKQWIVNFSSGSVRQSLSYDDFAAIPCIIPSNETVATFNIVDDIINNSSNFFDSYAMKLENLRNTLLPKLISGEIRVPEAKHLIEEAAE